MKNSFCLSGLTAALLGLGVVHGQGPTLGNPPASSPATLPTSPYVPAPMPAGSGNAPGNESAPFLGGDQAAAPVSPANNDSGSGGLSSWLAYPRGPGCCCQVGGNGPIGSEMYLRSGVTVPFGSGLFASDLRPGWDIEGGVRTLLFNPAYDAAWTVDLGVTNMKWGTTHNQSATISFTDQVPNGLGGTIPVVIPNQKVIPVGLNDTFVNLSIGREYYLWGGPATCKGNPEWRIGWDAGGRWGTSRLDLATSPTAPEGGTTIGGGQHKTGSLAGFFMSVHSDVEIPCGCWIMFAGVRAEYGYIYSDILQQNDTNLETLNIMFTIGGRF